MKNFLAIDTSGGYLCVVACKNGEYFTSFEEDATMKHSVLLMTKVDEVLERADLRLEACDFFAACVGAGSFTGIRIGVSTANAMALGSGAKLVEITELESLLIDEEVALGLIDCKHDNYYALFKDGDSLEYKAVNIIDVEPYEGKRVYFTSPEPKNLIKAFKNKVEKGEFSKIAQPYYMKKSSAEA